MDDLIGPPVWGCWRAEQFCMSRPGRSSGGIKVLYWSPEGRRALQLRVFGPAPVALYAAFYQRWFTLAEAPWQ